MAVPWLPEGGGDRHGAHKFLGYLKEAVTGMELTNDPRMLARPRAIISWLESTGLPLAANIES